MEKQPVSTTNPYAHLPVPNYALEWDAGAYRPKTLPAIYEPRIDPAHILALPDQDNGSELYVVAHRCSQCARVRHTCSRGFPTCKRCAEKDLPCKPIEKGWIEVPVPRKKPALRNEVQALRNSLPDAPYYREHSQSVAKSMSSPAEPVVSSLSRKGTRNAPGVDSVSPVQKGKRGDASGGRRLGAKRRGRKARASPGDSDDEVDETTEEYSPARPEASTISSSHRGLRDSSPTPSVRPSSAANDPNAKRSSEGQSTPYNPTHMPEIVQKTSNDTTTSSPESRDSALNPAFPSNPPPHTSSATALSDKRPAPTATPLSSEDVPATASTTISSAAVASTPINSGIQTSTAPVTATSASSRLSIRVPPRIGVVPYGSTSAQQAAEEFLGILRHASSKATPARPSGSRLPAPAASASTSTHRSRTPAASSDVSPAPLNAPTSASPATQTTSKPTPIASSSAVSAPTKEAEVTKETQNGSSQEDSSCNYRLSTTAWSNPASLAPSPAVQPQSTATPDPDSETSSDEPLMYARKRVNGTTHASTSVSTATSTSASTAGAGYKRKHPSEPAPDPVRMGTPWWTQASFPWYSAPYQHGMPGPSGGMMPVALPYIPAPMPPAPQRPPQPVEPFLSPLRPPIPSIQVRAERLAEAQQALATPQEEVLPPPPAREEVYDSEEEVEQYLKQSRKKKSGVHSSSSRTSPQEQRPLTFVPREKIFQDSIVVMVEDVLFHLPKSRLVQNSEYFARKVAKGREHDQDREEGSTDDEERTVDRCAVVKVKGVCAEDFEALLAVCDNPNSFLEKQPPFKTLSAIFCTSRTLRFSQLDALATYKLTTMWPSDLHKLSPVRTPYAAETVVLARTYNLPAVLKRAFYELLRSEGFAQHNVVDAPAPRAADSPSADADAVVDGSRLIGRAKLSHADLVRLITAREKLSLAWTLLVGSAPSSKTLPCMLQHTTSANAMYSTHAARERCAVATKNNAAIWAEWVLDSGLFESWMYDPVCGLERLSVLDWEHSGFCSSCVMARRQLWSKKREEIWENLDVWLGL